MAADIATQAAALMALANSALADASNTAGRIAAYEPNFTASFSHTVTDPLGAAPADWSGVVGTIGSFSYAVTLPTLTAPTDPATLLQDGGKFSHTVSAPSLAQPGDTSLLLGDDLRFDHAVALPGADKPLAVGALPDGAADAELLGWMNGEADLWFSRFFPELAAASVNKDKPEQWLWGILNGTDPFGMAPEAFTAIWNQARDREYRARNSAVDQLRQEFSARGFGLPPGAMIGAIARAEEQAADAIAGVNLAQMIRESEIKVDLLKFAEDQALRLKSGVMASLADFYRQWLAIPQQGLEKGRLQVAAYDSLQRALGDYYQVETRFEELRMKAAELRATGGIEESKLRVSAYSAMADALARYQSGEISLEDLRIKAEQLRASGVLEDSKLKVSTYSALQQAMNEYHRIAREYEALKAEMAKVGVETSVEGARLKVQAYAAMQGALTAYYQGKISVEELKLKTKQIEAEVLSNNDRNRASVLGQTYAAQASALGSASRAFGDIAAQAASGAGTINAQIASV